MSSVSWTWIVRQQYPWCWRRAGLLGAWQRGELQGSKQLPLLQCTLLVLTTQEEHTNGCPGIINESLIKDVIRVKLGFPISHHWVKTFHLISIFMKGNWISARRMFDFCELNFWSKLRRAKVLDILRIPVHISSSYLPQTRGEFLTHSESLNQSLSECSCWSSNWLKYFHPWYLCVGHFCVSRFWQLPKSAQKNISVSMKRKYFMICDLFEKLGCSSFIQWSSLRNVVK